MAVAVTLALLHSQPTSAATRTWTGLGVTNNWNDAANWSGGLVPGAGDVASFDGTSSKNAVMNVAVNVGGVSIAAYGGTITQAAGVTATVGATGWSQAGGTFVGGTAAFTVNGPFQLTSGSYTTTGGTMSVSGALTISGGTFSAPAGTVSFAGGAATLTVSTPAIFNNVTFAATKTLAAGTTLTVTGTTTLNTGNLNGTGTLAAQGAISQASTFTGGTATLAITGSANQTFSGTATLTNGSLPAVVINKPSGTLTLTGLIRTAGNWTYTAGTLDASAATLVFGGGTISGSQTLGAVHFRATTTLAAGTVLTVSGPLTLTAGSLNGPGSLTALGDVSQALGYGGGTAVVQLAGSVDQTLTGASTTASGSLPQLVINKPSGTLFLAGTIRTTSNWTYTAGTLDAGTSLVVFAAGTVSAAGMSFYDVTTNGGTTTLGAAMAVTHDLVVASGTFTTSGANHGLTVGGNLTVAGTFRENGSAVAIGGNVTNNGTVVPGTSTLTLNGSTGQSIGGSATMPAFHLVIADPLGVTLSTDLTVTGTLTLTSGQLSLGARRLTISNAIAGVPTNLIGGATSSMTVTGAGAGISMPSSVAQLNALTLSNANGLALQADLTIEGTLTLTTGRLDAGANTVIIGPAGTVVRTSGWVVGRLQKPVAAGLAVARTFEIGDATSYAPVAITFATVTTPGRLTASTTAGDHPDIANSGVAVAQDVNRFWTITNGGVAFDTYDGTFTFVAADIDPGADPTVFIVAKLDGTTWSLPTTATRTASSTQAIGMTSFSDVVVGEPTADLAVSVGDGLATVTAGDGLAHGYTITVTNAGPSDATGVVVSDVWPTGFSLGLVSPSQGSCAPIGAGPDFSCALGTIAAGASATVSVAYTVGAATPGGDQTEIVSVASSVVDPNAADDAASDTTTVLAAAPTPAPVPAPRLAPSPSPGASPSSDVGAAAPDTDTGGQRQAVPPDAGLDLTILVLSGLLSIVIVMLGLFKSVSDRRRG